MNRRLFLSNAFKLTSLSAAHAVFPGLARATMEAAARGEPRFLVMLPVFSRMDTTLGLDPWLGTPNEKELFLGYRESDVLGKVGQLFGPAMAPLLPYASDICAVNGIVMHETNVDHTANFNYMTTGRGTGAGDIVVSAAMAGQGPRGIVTSGALNSGTASVVFADTAYLMNLVSQRTGVDLLCRAKSLGEDALSRARRTACSSQEVTTKMGAAFNTLKAKQADSGASNEALVIAAAFAAGASYQAKLVINPVQGTIDSHSSHIQSHLPAQTSVWTQVAALFRLFKSVEILHGRSLFDCTTFITMSDFSRTPALNSAQGKDHNPQCNSVLIAGYGVNGGRSIGKSTVVKAKDASSGVAELWGMPIDFKTGQPIESREAAQSPAANFIVPENVIGSVLSLFLPAHERLKLGFDENAYPLIPGLIRGA